MWPDLGGHLKTGQRGVPKNRPFELAIRNNLLICILRRKASPLGGGARPNLDETRANNPIWDYPDQGSTIASGGKPWREIITKNFANF